MLKCSICQTENDPFATVCRQCGGFLQNRVPNLNLFETVWGMLEAPKKTFETIVMAEHKNFSLLLFSLFGVGISFTAFWYYKLGNLFQTLPELLVVTAGIGIGGGILFSPIIVLMYHFVARFGGRKATYRTGYAVLAYSTTPIVLALILVLPIELLTFGMFLFTHNPPPLVIKPASYVVLLGFDALAGLWSVWLAVRGTTVAYRVGWVHALTATIVAVAGVLLAVVVTKELLT